LTYQGRLDSGTAPADGTYDFIFALQADDIGAAPVGAALPRLAVPVANGLFTVTLDFGNQFPGSPRWLEIAVRTNGGGAFATLVPRQRLTATPYAIQTVNATAAGTVTGGVPAGQITGTLPLAQLPAPVVTNGASGVNIAGTFTGNGAGVTNVNLALNSGGAFSLSGGFALVSSPSVGLAPFSVTAADVNGDGKPDLISANSGDSTLTVLFNTATFAGSFTGNGSGLTAVPAESLTGTVADARLSANVALRNASQTFSAPNTFNASVTLNPPANLSFGSQTRQMISLWGSDYGIGVQSDTTYFRTGSDFSWFRGGSHEDGSGDPGPDGCALMRLDRNGNLGLGISSPSYTLDAVQSQAVGRFTTVSGVNGSVLILQNIRSAPTYLGAISFEDANATPGQIGYLASGQMTFRVAGADRMNLQAGGLFVNGAVVLTSDRNAKADFASVDAQEVLEKVAALPLQSWSYTNRPGVKHVGPMAQDFRAAFGLG
jgi:uncharacterized protein YaiE (UPF0345 family)